MTEGNGQTPAAGDVHGLAEHFFRHEAGTLVSVLTGIFGIDRLQLAEDVVQEALLRALRTWPYYGVPRNPAAWITQTAKNLALDVIRRETRFRDKQPEIAASLEHWASDSAVSDLPLFDGEIKDSRLRLMFACCHPLIPLEAQTALALKTLCGFSVGEIAKAFLAKEAAIAKRLTRAREKIQDLHIPLEIPSGEELASRLDGVLQTLYLLFNEGYKASSGENLVRADLCFEAARLATALAEHPVGNHPRTHALVALMLLNAARLPARSDAAGNILRLRDQDRSHWNKGMVALGMLALRKSAAGIELSEYHLQAGIAACHCLATDYASTDWPRIVSLYEQLMRINNSPVAALNRAVAIAQVHGPPAGLAALEAIPDLPSLSSYYLLYAVRAEFQAQLGDFDAAAENLRTAIRFTDLRSEQALLRQRLRECERQSLGSCRS